MPYASVGELPDSVKKLPAKAQRAFMGAFNAAHAAGKPEADCFKIGWGAAHAAIRAAGKANPWHDTAGRFTSPGGAGGAALGTIPWDSLKGGGPARGGHAFSSSELSDEQRNELFAGSTPYARRALIELVDGAKIPVEHMAGIGKFSDEPPFGIKTGSDAYVLEERNFRAAACYFPPQRSVHIHKTQLQATSTLLHEVGHHVTMTVFHGLADGNQCGSALDRAKALSLKGRTEAGLRDYSLTSKREFAADTYLVHMRGGPDARTRLARLWNVKDLGELFRQPKAKALAAVVIGRFAHEGFENE